MAELQKALNEEEKEEDICWSRTENKLRISVPQWKDSQERLQTNKENLCQLRRQGVEILFVGNHGLGQRILENLDSKLCKDVDFNFPESGVNPIPEPTAIETSHLVLHLILHVTICMRHQHDNLVDNRFLYPASTEGLGDDGGARKLVEEYTASLGALRTRKLFMDDAFTDLARIIQDRKIRCTLCLNSLKKGATDEEKKAFDDYINRFQTALSACCLTPLRILLFLQTCWRVSYDKLV